MRWGPVISSSFGFRTPDFFYDQKAAPVGTAFGTLFD